MKMRKRDIPRYDDDDFTPLWGYPSYGEIKIVWDLNKNVSEFVSKNVSVEYCEYDKEKWKCDGDPLNHLQTNSYLSGRRKFNKLIIELFEMMGSKPDLDTWEVPIGKPFSEDEMEGEMIVTYTRSKGDGKTLDELREQRKKDKPECYYDSRKKKGS